MLTEGDDQQDPIADAARAILDGHVVLSRRIAEAGQYPAVDVEASVSRVMHEIIPPEHAELARRFRQTLAIYQQHRDLINIGAYQKGSDPRIDAAIELWPAMQKFLMQPIEQRVSHADAVNALRQLFATARRTRKARMKRSERLDVVQQAAARTERERAERVGAAERHLVEMQQKLTALEKYRSEYESGFATRAGGGVDVIGMRDFQTFLARLGEALAQQRELVTLAQRALDAERSQLARGRAARARGRDAGRALAGRRDRAPRIGATRMKATNCRSNARQPRRAVHDFTARPAPDGCQRSAPIAAAATTERCRRRRSTPMLALETLAATCAMPRRRIWRRRSARRAVSTACRTNSLGRTTMAMPKTAMTPRWHSWPCWGCSITPVAASQAAQRPAAQPQGAEDASADVVDDALARQPSGAGSALPAQCRSARTRVADTAATDKCSLSSRCDAAGWRARTAVDPADSAAVWSRAAEWLAHGARHAGRGARRPSPLTCAIRAGPRTSARASR